MRRHALVLAGLLALVVLVPVAAQDRAFEPATCPVEVPAGEVEGETVECGYLTVPADHLDDDGSTIELAVAIVRSSSEQPAPDPVLYLEGGPGGEAVSNMDTWIDSPILDERDIILLDQRGTGFSRPLLDCLELEGGFLDAELKATRVCRKQLRAAGIDLDAFDSRQSAADIEALREALGYDAWNLLGISYGTRFALTVLREYPEGVRSVVLDGVYPPQVNSLEQTSIEVAGLEELFDACAAERTCADTFPQLERDFWAAVRRLERKPLRVRYVDDDGFRADERIDGISFSELVIDLLNDVSVIPYLPAIIDGTAARDARPLRYLLEGALPPDGDRLWPRQAVTDDPDGDAGGMYLSVECREEVPFNDRQTAIADARTAPSIIRWAAVDDVRFMFDSCEAWRVDAAPAIEAQAVVSDTPALVFNGQFDVATPAEWGRVAAEGLANSWVYDIPGAGHGTIDAGDCPNQLITSFLDDPQQTPDDACVAEMGGPEWVVRGLRWRR